MFVVNNTTQTLNFNFKENLITLKPGDIYPLSFDVEKSKEIIALVKKGYLTIIDLEQYDPDEYFYTVSNFKKSQRQIIPEDTNVFENLVLDDDF